MRDEKACGLLQMEYTIPPETPDRRQLKNNGPIRSDDGSARANGECTTGRSMRKLVIDDISIAQPVSFMRLNCPESALSVLRGAINTIRLHRMPILVENTNPRRDTGKAWLRTRHGVVRRVREKPLKSATCPS